MLRKFEVSNFKNFRDVLSFDLSKTKSYEFNPDCVKNNVVNKSLVYGYNGVGKSNLGFAIFDLICHLTDKYKNATHYENYLNAYDEDGIAKFKYEFSLESGTVCYEYGKADLESLIYETVTINGREFASIDRRISTVANVDAEGAEHLITDVGSSGISIVVYIIKNSVLKNNKDNLCFLEFVEFVAGMLFFRSLESNDYIGFEQGRAFIDRDIVDHGHLEDFEEFLNTAGIDCKLAKFSEGDRNSIAFDFNGRLVPFYQIASQGTRSLALFYYWLLRLRGSESPVTFLFIDEFDAFYHHDLSALVVRMLRDINAQVVITTHNTSIMTNELMRPDCYFLMDGKSIHSLANSTPKELREAHNIEKMYKAGSFDG
jgi:hypothetical protein